MHMAQYEPGTRHIQYKRDHLRTLSMSVVRVQLIRARIWQPGPPCRFPFWTFGVSVPGVPFHHRAIERGGDEYGLVWMPMAVTHHLSVIV